jgi:hypothetical protein
LAEIQLFLLLWAGLRNIKVTVIIENWCFVEPWCVRILNISEGILAVESNMHATGSERAGNVV